MLGVRSLRDIADDVGALDGLTEPLLRRRAGQARASGKDHPHAIRILARAWIRIIWPCWINGIPYDPDKHGAAVALNRQAENKLAA